TQFWPVLLALTLSLSACSSNDDAADAPIRFTNYYPDISRDFCTYKSEYTFGQVGDTVEHRRLTSVERDEPRNQLSTKLILNEKIANVPYLSGTLRGSRYSTWSEENTEKEIAAITVYKDKDDNTLKFLGYGEILAGKDQIEDWLNGADCNLGSHPSMWSFGTIKNGEIRNKNSTFFYTDVTTDPPLCDGTTYRRPILTKVANIQLESGLFYNNAVIFYYLDVNDAPYNDLDMDGIDRDLGIVLPTTAETGGIAVEYIEIYGRDTGLVASGHFNVGTTEPGRLHHFIELTDVVTCNP
ncbi:MAG: hypothetical protein ACC707_20055, partial [Thiohalomonadales bacterium]